MECIIFINTPIKTITDRAEIDLENFTEKNTSIEHRKRNTITFNFILQIFKAINEVKKEKRIVYIYMNTVKKLYIYLYDGDINSGKKIGIINRNGIGDKKNKKHN
jgi:hypothetical protein